MMFFDPELFSALSASLMLRTLRANSMNAYWNPAQVPRKGQSRRRANSIPLSMPSKLLKGLPGEAQRPSKLSSVFSAVAEVSGRSRDPLGFDFQVELAGGVLQGVVGGVVRAEIGIEVAQDSDADGVAHGLIVLEGASRTKVRVAEDRLEEWCVDWCNALRFQ